MWPPVLNTDSLLRVLAMLVPTAFFAALDRGAGIAATDPGLPPPFVPLVNDHVRRDILRMSRGISVILLVMSVDLPHSRTIV